MTKNDFINYLFGTIGLIGIGYGICANTKLSKVSKRLDKSIDDRLFSMFIGGIGIYNSKKIDNMCRKIIPTLPLDKYNIQ